MQLIQHQKIYWWRNRMYFDETAWVAIAFLLFFVLVWKKGKKAILSLLDERSILIEKELNEAKSLKEEALEELRLSLQNQKNVSDEAENLIKDAKEKLKTLSGQEVILIRAASDSGQLFGSVTTKDIVNSLAEKNITVLKNEIDLK